MVHGYTQNATVFQGRMSSVVRKMLKRPGGSEFVYVDAPHLVGEGCASGDRPPETQRAWFRPGEPGKRPVESRDYVGWEASLAHLEAAVDAEGSPFYCIVSFSQGTTLAAAVVARRPELFERAIFIAGMGPRDAGLRAAFDGARGDAPIPVPTLHVVGEADPFVSVDRARGLADCFEAPEMAVHDGGHVVPPGALRAQVRAFYRGD